MLLSCRVSSLALIVAAVLSFQTAVTATPTILHVTRYADVIRFSTQGEIEGLRIEIFSLTGQMLFDSGFQTGTIFDWQMQTTSGQQVGTGVYLFVVSMTEKSGKLTQHLYKLALTAERVNLAIAPQIEMPVAAPAKHKSCIQTTIAANKVIEGELSTNDCHSPQRPSRYADQYFFPGRAGQLVRFRAISTETEVFLTLIAPRGQQASFDCFGVGEEYACIPKEAAPGLENSWVTLPSNGTYVIEVSEISPDASKPTGKYTLSFESQLDACSYLGFDRIATGRSGYFEITITSPDVGGNWVYNRVNLSATARDGYWGNVFPIAETELSGDVISILFGFVSDFIADLLKIGKKVSAALTLGELSLAFYRFNGGKPKTVPLGAITFPGNVSKYLLQLKSDNTSQSSWTVDFLLRAYIDYYPGSLIQTLTGKCAVTFSGDSWKKR